MTEAKTLSTRTFWLFGSPPPKKKRAKMILRESLGQKENNWLPAQFLSNLQKEKEFRACTLRCHFLQPAQNSPSGLWPMQVSALHCHWGKEAIPARPSRGLTARKPALSMSKVAGMVRTSGESSGHLVRASPNCGQILPHGISSEEAAPSKLLAGTCLSCEHVKNRKFTVERVTFAPASQGD